MKISTFAGQLDRLRPGAGVLPHGFRIGPYLVTQLERGTERRRLVAATILLRADERGFEFPGLLVANEESLKLRRVATIS